MNVPFTTGLGGRQGAQACSSDRADLGDDPSALVVVVLETASGAVGRRFESCRGHHPLQHPNLWLLIAGPTIRLSPSVSFRPSLIVEGVSAGRTVSVDGVGVLPNWPVACQRVGV